MRSIGAPVMRAVEGYRDEEDGASARMPLQPYNADVVPNGIANGHPNGNGAALPNGAVHANGRPRDVGGTSGPPNGVAKPLLNQYSNGVSHHGAAPAAPNGVGSTGIVDLTGDDDIVHAAPPAAVQTTPTKAPGPDSGRKKRVSKPISPAARWEAKMEARRSVAGPSSRPASTKAGSSKGRKSSLGNGSTPTAIAPAPAPNGPAPAVVKKVRKKRVRKKKLPPPPDPDVPYPAFSDNFEMSKETVGDMLQVYDFCIAFAKTLRIASFSLRDFEIAVTTPERTPLVDAIVVRCVRTMLNDKAVSLELDLTEKTRQHLKTRKSSEAVEKTFKELAYLFSIDDEGDESGDNSAGNPGEFRGFVDETLDAVVLKMRQTSSTWALYDVLSTDERLRVLRELVDRVASTEEVRACVINSVEFEEEERKKAREDIIVQRREAENELKELRAAHTAFREKHGLTPAAIAAAEAAAKEEAAAAKKASKSKSKKKKAALAKAPSRKELVIKAQKERAAAAKKRKIERDEENLLQKIEKVKTTIKLIKARSAKPGATKREDGEKPTAEEAAEMEKAAEAEIHLDQSERNDEDPVRMHALGTDREHRRYYYFAGGGRLWVEMTKSNVWAYAEETALINGLLEWLSPHRKGERALKTVLEKKLPAIEEDMRRLAKTREKEAVAIANLARAPRTRAGKRKGVSNGDGPAGQSFFI